MNENLQFSIVVPVYNVEKYVAKCIDSLLCQEGEDYEIIVVDDGSQDRSIDIVENICREYPQKLQIIHQENRGLGGARNTGLLHAKGQYVVFVDSDDYVSSNFLKDVRSKLRENPDCDVVVFGMIAVDMDDNEVFRDIDDKIPEAGCNLKNFPDLLNCSVTCNKVYRADMLRKAGIKYPEHRKYEDLDTVFRIWTVAEKVVLLNGYYYYYVLREGSITRDGTTDGMTDICKAFDNIMSLVETEPVLCECTEQIFKLMYQHVIGQACNAVKLDYKSNAVCRLRNYFFDHVPLSNRKDIYAELDFFKKMNFILLQSENYKGVYVSQKLERFWKKFKHAVKRALLQTDG